MAPFVLNLMRRLGFLPRRAPFRGGSILGATLGAAVGSLLLKRILFSRRATKERDLYRRGRLSRSEWAALVPSRENDMTPPHGDVLARSVNTASTPAPQR